MKKISILLSSLEYGGGEIVSISKALILKERGYDVEFVLLEYKGELIEEVKKKFKIFTLNKSIYKSLFLLIYYLYKSKSKILISNYFSLNIISSIAGFILLKKTILCEHSPPSQTPFIKPVSYKIFATLFYNLSYIISANSIGTCEDILKSAKIKKNKVIPIYNPVDDHGYRVDYKKKNNTKLKIVSVGKLKEQNNFFLLLDALALINKKIDSELVLIGDGLLKSKLLLYAREKGISDKVNFVGYMKDPYKLVSKCDVFVLSSDYEGLPTVLIEAAYTGIAIVSTDCPWGPKEILESYELSELVPIRNPIAMSEAILKISKNEINKINNFKTLDKFNPEKIVDQYEVFF